MFCYLEFKLRYLKNLKLFSIRVKELFEPIVMRKQLKKATDFCTFKGVLHPSAVFGLFLHFSQKLQHIGDK